MEKKKVSFLTKILVLLFVVLAGLISWAILQQINKKKAIQAEITKLQQEAEKISRDNISAQERISYLATQDYQEREAKDKLNLKDPEENVVIVKPGIEKKESVQETNPIVINQPESVAQSNPWKWWTYFTRQ